MTDGRRNTEKGYWSTTITSGGASMYVWERLDRDGALFVKYNDPRGIGADRRVKRRLPGEHQIRKANGTISKAGVEALEKEVEKAVGRLANGQDPFPVVVPPPASDMLTVQRGFEMMLEVPDGKFATKSLRWQELNRAQRRLERLLKDTLFVDALAPKVVTSIWRRLANEYKAEQDLRERSLVVPSAPKAAYKRWPKQARKVAKQEPLCGARQTEVTVDALYVAAEWLVKNEKLKNTDWQRIKEWRSELKNDWQKITGEDIRLREKLRVRHSVAEMQRLFAVLDDPRRRAFRVLAQSCPEQALAGARWSGLQFDDLGAAVGLRLTWMKVVRTPGVARGACETRSFTHTFMLDRVQQSRVAEALKGYLRDLEARRASGDIADYPLFPAGDLRDGVAPSTAVSHLSAEGDSMLTLDERFELAFELGGEQRMGQVLRSTRSRLFIVGVDRVESDIAGEHGVLHVPDERKKPAEAIQLSARQRAWLVDAMEHGYLREFEAQRRAGRIKDYPLFPEGRMKQCVATFRPGASALTRGAALKMFKHLESVAGVESLPKRGWYGVRRVASDRIKDVTQDPRVQKKVMNNSDETRVKHYENSERPEDFAAARDAREQMRGRATATLESELARTLKQRGFSVTEEQLARMLESLRPDAPPQSIGD